MSINSSSDNNQLRQQTALDASMHWKQYAPTTFEATVHIYAMFFKSVSNVPTGKFDNQSTSKHGSLCWTACGNAEARHKQIPVSIDFVYLVLVLHTCILGGLCLACAGTFQMTRESHTSRQRGLIFVRPNGEDWTVRWWCSLHTCS